MKLMKCGHTAQGHLYNKDGTKIECCIICDCTEPATELPDLTSRTAKCFYFGSHKPKRRYANDECNYGCSGKSNCECGSEPSNTELAFFKHHPDREQDEFYCGCFGWD